MMNMNYLCDYFPQIKKTVYTALFYFVFEFLIV